MARSIVYSDVGVELKNKAEALTVDEAKQILGWIDEKTATEKAGKKVQFGNEFTLRDALGNKVRLANNMTNRPHRRTLSMRYANEVLRKKWALNGESIVVDRYGYVQDGQHRLVGLVLAEQMRTKTDEAKQHWKDQYGWTGACRMDALIVTGISEASEVVDTLNLGQKRTLSDVLFRGHDFTDEVEKELTEKDIKRLSGILAGATRLVWLRASGQTVSDAPHFPHSEALDFISNHPMLTKAAKFIDEENVENKIANYVSTGYATALLYLLGTSGTDPDKYHNEGVAALDFSNWEKAEAFWTEFANGEKALHSLRTVLTGLDASGGAGRDEIVGTIIKAMNLWMEGKPVETKAIKMKKGQKDGRSILSETPRLGGLDVEVVIEKPEPEAKPEPAPAPKPAGKGKGKAGRPARKAAPSFTKGDKVQVKDDDGDHWQGTVQEVNGENADVLADADGDLYTVALSTMTKVAA